jgi:cytochrome-b5 reductase
MRFLLFGVSLATGAAAHAWRKSSTIQAYNPPENVRHFKTDPKRNQTFDYAFQSFVLGEVVNLAKDVAIFRFLLHKPEDVFDLQPCSTLQACFKDGTSIIEQPMRHYTPITPYGAKGYFDLLVKKQKGGRFTEHLFSMEAGETLLFRRVQYKLDYAANKWRHIGLIGGGTGLTPLLQVIVASLNNPDDKTKLSLLFANQSENKILLKGLLDEFQQKSDNRFEVHYTVDRADNPETWKGRTGHISAQMIRETMPPPAKDILLMVCGPDKMMNKLVGAPFMVLRAMSGGNAYQPTANNLNNFSEVEGIVGSLGYTQENVYRF